MGDAGPRPFFILGTMRSGTTLLRLMLDSHPNISVGFETGFMRAATLVKDIPDWNYGKGWYRRYGLTEEEMNDRLRAFYSEIFQQHAEAQGKSRWGEKTPMNVHYLRDLVRMFPDGQFLAIVRHAGAVATSMARWKRYTFESALDYWVTVNRRLRKRARDIGAERFHLCRYEDLVTQPRPVLEQVLGFLDEPWSDDVLRHHEVQPAQGAPAEVEGGTRSDRAVDAAHVDAWCADLSDERLELLRRDARPLLRSFGYRVRSAVPDGVVTGAASPPTNRAGAARFPTAGPA